MQRKRRVMGAIVCSVALTLNGPAAGAATRGAPAAAGCSTAAAFGQPQWRQQTMTFRATVEIVCPLGRAFSATLRSSNGCELRSQTGGTLRYELFSDVAMQAPVVSCERPASALSGSGRRTFVMYGRVSGPVAAIGVFYDALLTSISP